MTFLRREQKDRPTKSVSRRALDCPPVLLCADHRSPRTPGVGSVLTCLQAELWRSLCRRCLCCDACCDGHLGVLVIKVISARVRKVPCSLPVLVQYASDNCRSLRSRTTREGGSINTFDESGTRRRTPSPVGKSSSLPSQETCCSIRLGIRNSVRGFASSVHSMTSLLGTLGSYIRRSPSYIARYKHFPPQAWLYLTFPGHHFCPSWYF